MSLRSAAGTALWLVVLLVVLSLVVGHAVGQPIFLGYVTSGSMAPSVDEGDAFVSVPQPIAGEPEVGDVVVFQARELHDGGLVTHRVEAVRDDGYVTKGDANPFTDQDGSEPLVRDDQLVGEALQVRGSVVTVPLVGTVAGVVQEGQVAARDGISGLPLLGELGDRGGFGAALVALGLGLVALALRSEGGRTLRRSRARAASVPIWAPALAVALLVVLVASAAMLVPAGVHEFGAVAESSPDGDDSLSVAPGASTTVNYDLRNPAPVPLVVVQSPRHEALDVADRRVTVGGRATVTTSTTFRVPDETGVHYRSVEQYYYFAVLPPPLIERLHDVHPVLALLVVDGVVGGAVLGVVFLALGTGDLRVRSRSSEVPLSVRLRRRLP